MDCIYYAKDKKFFTLDNNGKTYEYDFCIPSKKIIIEFDEKEPTDLDIEKQKFAESKGYKVFRVSEVEYLKDETNTIANIAKLVLENIK